MRSTFTTLAFLCCTLIFTFSVKAQVIYTDIDPDTVLTPPSGHGWSYSINIDTAGYDDFQIQINNMSAGYESVRISANEFFSQVAGDGDTSTGENFHPIAYNVNDSISGNTSAIWFNYWDYQWQHSLNMIIAGYGIVGSGNWEGGSTGKYLGVRMKKNGNWYYGWIGIDVPSDANACTIRDFAIETTPGKAIIAGNNTSAISEKEEKENFDFAIQDRILQIRFSERMENRIIRISDLSGKILQNVPTDGNEIMIELNSLIPGIYLLSVITSENVSSTRLIID